MSHQRREMAMKHKEKIRRQLNKCKKDVSELQIELSFMRQLIRPERKLVTGYEVVGAPSEKAFAELLWQKIYRGAVPDLTKNPPFRKDR